MKYEVRSKKVEGDGPHGGQGRLDEAGLQPGGSTWLQVEKLAALAGPFRLPVLDPFHSGVIQVRLAGPLPRVARPR